MSIERLTAAVEALVTKVEAIERRVLLFRETFTLEELTELPEAPSLATLRNNPDRQPNRGVPDGFRGKKKAWRRETVEAWRRNLDSTPSPRGFYRNPKHGGAA